MRKRRREKEKGRGAEKVKEGTDFVSCKKKTRNIHNVTVSTRTRRCTEPGGDHAVVELVREESSLIGGRGEKCGVEIGVRTRSLNRNTKGEAVSKGPAGTQGGAA